jgi:hypothetical protein
MMIVLMIIVLMLNSTFEGSAAGLRMLGCMRLANAVLRKISA